MKRIMIYRPRGLFGKILAYTMPMLLVSSATVYASYLLYSSENAKQLTLRSLSGRVRFMITSMEREEERFLLDDLKGEDFHKSGVSRHLKTARDFLDRGYVYALELCKTADGEQKARAQRIISVLDSHNIRFKDVVEHYRIRGFNKWGLEANWRASLDDLENGIKKTSPNNLLKIAAIRTAAFEYFHRKDVTMAASVQSQFDQLQKQIEKRKSSKKRHILQKIITARSIFFRYTEVDSRLGLRGDRGLRLLIRHGFDVFEENVTAIAETAITDAEAARTKFQGMVAMELLLILIAQTFVLYFAAKSIEARDEAEAQKQNEDLQRMDFDNGLDGTDKKDDQEKDSWAKSA